MATHKSCSNDSFELSPREEAVARKTLLIIARGNELYERWGRQEWRYISKDKIRRSIPRASHREIDTAFDYLKKEHAIRFSKRHYTWVATKDFCDVFPE